MKLQRRCRKILSRGAHSTLLALRKLRRYAFSGVQEEALGVCGVSAGLSPKITVLKFCCVQNMLEAHSPLPVLRRILPFVVSAAGLWHAAWLLLCRRITWSVRALVFVRSGQAGRFARSV